MQVWHAPDGAALSPLLDSPTTSPGGWRAVIIGGAAAAAVTLPLERSAPDQAPL